MEDHAECFRKVFQTLEEDEQTAQNIKERHQRHEFLRDRRDTPCAAEENECGTERGRRTHAPAGKTESRPARFGNGVGLDHRPHESECQNGRNGEKTGKKPSECSAESRPNVENGAAVKRPVVVDLPCFLGEYRLGIDRRHAEEGNDPHPEDRTGTADQDRAARTDDISRPDLCRDRSGECLEGTQAPFLLLSVQGNAPKDLLHPLAKAPDLNESRPDREVDPDPHEEKNENVIGKVKIDLLNGFKYILHGRTFCVPQIFRWEFPGKFLEKSRKIRKNSGIFLKEGELKVKSKNTKEKKL